MINFRKGSADAGSAPRKASVIYRLVLLVVVALVLEGAFCAGYFGVELLRLSDSQTEEFRQDIVAQKKESLKDLVQMAYSTVERYHDQSRDEDALKAAKSEELSKIIESIDNQITTFYRDNVDDMEREELERAIKEMVAAVRYDGSNYIWINDTHPTMIMHPIKPSLDGRDLSDFKDPEGTFLFNEMAEVCKAEGEGMVTYLWAKPGEDTPKLKVSYVKLMEELGWILGTGAWIEDITGQMKREALDQVSKLRLRDGNYFWINDTHPRMVMHPIKPALDGQDLSGFEDTKGKKLFVEMAEKAAAQGDGFVEYWWGKPGEEGEFPKTSYVRLFEPWGWVIGMGVYMDDVDQLVAAKQARFEASLRSIMLWAMIMGAVFLAVVAGLTLWYIQYRLGRPLRSLVGFSQRVAEGDLDAEASGTFRGELLTLRLAVESMVASLKEQMAEARAQSERAAEDAAYAKSCATEAEQAKAEAENARLDGMRQAADELEEIVGHVTRAADELAELAEEVGEGTYRQKQRVGETATAMEEMNATVLEVARNASSAAENADGARSKANEGEGVVSRSVAAIQRVHEMARQLKRNMDALTQQSDAIGKVINVINDIADQTNLLALNAAIEAARAGEAGRGFAVVADEVRKLAEKTMAATKEVGESIGDIQRSTNLNNEHVDQAVSAVAEATELAEESGAALREIVGFADNTADQVRSIATASEEQSAASEEITRAVEEISEVAAATAEGMSRASKAQSNLGRQAQELKRLIDDMKRG